MEAAERWKPRRDRKVDSKGHFSVPLHLQLTVTKYVSLPINIILHDRWQSASRAQGYLWPRFLPTLLIASASASEYSAKKNKLRYLGTMTHFNTGFENRSHLYSRPLPT
jgi:hypothetical protein